MAIGKPDRNTVLLSLLNRQRRAGTFGGYDRLPHSRYSYSGPLGPKVEPEISDEEEKTPLPRNPEADAEDFRGSVGDAPAPTGQGVGIGPIAGMAPSAVVGLAANIGLGASNPVFGIPTLLKLVRDSIEKGRTDIDEGYRDPSDVKSQEENPEIMSEFTTIADPGFGTVKGPLPDPSDVIANTEAAGGTSGGNAGGSSSPGGFGGPMSGGGQEGDAGAANTGTTNAGPTGPSGSVCIIVTTCTHRHSDEVNITREFRDRYLDRSSLGGYYAIANVVVPYLKKYKAFKRFTKKYLVDRLIDYAEKTMGYKDRYKYKSSFLITRGFLGFCSLVGTMVDTETCIAPHEI